MTQQTNINEILAERGKRYGEFITHARITQDFKRLQHHYTITPLTDDMQESLDMIFHKIGRILNGDPEYADSWVDIAGYAQLVATRLTEKERISQELKI